VFARAWSTPASEQLPRTGLDTGGSSRRAAVRRRQGRFYRRDRTLEWGQFSRQQRLNALARCKIRVLHSSVFRISGRPILLAAQLSVSLRRAAGTLQNFFDFFDGNSQAEGRDLATQEFGVFRSEVVKLLGQ
jgi:hypothetical protein